MTAPKIIKDAAFGVAATFGVVAGSYGLVHVVKFLVEDCAVPIASKVSEVAGEGLARLNCNLSGAYCPRQ